MGERVAFTTKLAGTELRFDFLPPMIFFMIDFSNIIGFENACSKIVWQRFNNYFFVFFHFRAEYGFPVVVHGRRNRALIWKRSMKIRLDGFTIFS